MIHAPGFLDTSLQTGLRLYRSNWRICLYAGLVKISIVCYGNPFELVWQADVLFIAMMALQSLQEMLNAARDAILTVSIRNFIVAEAARTSYWHASIAFLVSCARGTVQVAWFFARVSRNALQLALIVVRAFVLMQLVLAVSGLVVDTILGEEDAEVKPLCVWAGVSVYQYLSMRLAQHAGRWWGMLGMRLLVIVSSAATYVILAVIVPLTISVDSSEVALGQLLEGLQLIQLFSPLFKSGTLASLRAQGSTKMYQITRKITRRPVIPRLPVPDEICAICHDDLCIEDDAQPLVHCKWGCGRAVHGSCMDDWGKHRLSPAECLFCGSFWS